MTIVKEFFFGLGRYKKALSFSREHRLTPYYLLSALANLIIIGLIWYFAWGYAANFIGFIEAKLGIGEKTGWIWQALDFVLSLLVYALVILLYIKLYQAVVLTLTAPVLAMVAEKVQCILRNEKEAEFDWGRLMSDALRGISISLKNLFFELGLVGLLMFVSLFLPPLSFVAPFLVVLIQSYFHGFSMIDLRNEFLRMSEADSRTLIKKHKGFSVGIGLAFHLLLLVPVLGALFGPILGVVAAGIGIHELDGQKAA